jgi:hypothetical protein
MGLDYFVNCTIESHFAHWVLGKAPFIRSIAPGYAPWGSLWPLAVLQMLNLFILNFVPINSL